ncbi:MAG TPA: DUF2125 domain-containing protein [Acetobacteraceae bacterium]|nr:DUF2125 domain-containing protein [Acetobacteraceae bacterium]
MRRLLWVVPLVLLLAAALVDAGVWYVTEQWMRAELQDWVVARRADGWSISAVAPAAGGWPIAATLTLRDFELSGGKADLPNGVAWRADRVVLRLTPQDPHTLRVEAMGLQHLRVSSLPAIAYSAAKLELSVPLQVDPMAQPLDLRGAGLRAHVPVGGAEDSMTIGSLLAHLVLHPGVGRGQPAVTIAASSDEIALPRHVDWPLGPHLHSIAIDAALDGPLSDAPTLTQRATAWRDGGGAIDLRRAALHWGALDLTAHATLTLDDELQPSGSATAKAVGYAQTLDVMARHDVITNSAALTAKAMLSLIAAPPAPGRPAEVEVPLSLRRGTLAMHDIPLLKLPELDWPRS